MNKRYMHELRALLSPAEHAVFKKLTTPEKIQDRLDHFPINFELAGDTIYSPRVVMRENKAHCVEGALFAAAALAYHGSPPYVMDIQTTADDYDHVVTLFQRDGRWGAMSKTNHIMLRWRDPIYESPRELAMSYFHEYFLNHGRKTMRAYSRPFDLSRYAPQWVTTEGDLSQLILDLDDSPHSPVAPPKAIKNLRKVTKVEIKSLDITEWAKNGKKRRL